MRVWIFVDDTLELIPGDFSAFFGGSEAGNSGLRGRSSWAKRRLKRSDGLRHIQARLFILRAQVIPSARYGATITTRAMPAAASGVPVFHTPVSSLLGGPNRHPAECVLFKLMASLCAHEDPF